MVHMSCDRTSSSLQSCSPPGRAGWGRELSVHAPLASLAVTALVILALLGNRPILAAAVALPGGEPDANCSDLRLWLRADAGVRDAAGHGPTDPEFSGSVAAWSDQSARHFDLVASPERAPSFVPRQPGAGNRPTVAFGGGRILARPKESLHDLVNSTTLLVLQIQRGRQQGSFVFSAGDTDGKRETLSFEHSEESDAAQGHVRWSTGEIRIVDTLQFAADGRFAIVLLRSAGQNSSVEVQDGLGDALGADREMNPTGHAAVSNHCGQGYCLGGPKLDPKADQSQSYDGQIAEVMVYNRALSSAERRQLVAYLRRKYELDVLDALFPAGTLLLQAEDFDGPWQIVNRHGDSRSSQCLGQRHVTSKGQHNPEGIKRTVLISRPGNYWVWVRAVGSGKENALRTSVGGKPLAVTHSKGPWGLSWQLAGTVDLPPGETEIVVRGEGPGDKDCDAVLISPSVTTLAGVEAVCALAQRLRHTPSPGQLTAVFDDGRRIDGNLVSGWRGSGAQIARAAAACPALCCLLLDCLAADPAPQPEAWLEFHNGDRMRGTLCGSVAASTQAGQSAAAQVLVQPSQDLGKSAGRPIAVEVDWLRRIVFDVAGPPRHCPPRSLICRDGRVIAFRALRFSGEGVSLLTDKGLVRLAYGDLAEVAMPPMDAWEAYYRQLAVIDPAGDAGIVRLETAQDTVLTASTTRATSFRNETEAAASTCLVEPAWSHTPIPVAWSAVRMQWRAPATIVPLSLFTPQRVTQRGALGSSWKWQTDRNVAGGELRNSGVRYLWGFGVHAPNELVFRLPDSARAFRCGLGIDAAVGDSGCVVGRVYLNQASGTPLFQSQPLVGSRTAVSTGEIALAAGNSTTRQLLLVAEDGGDARGPNADPLDIGDHADWLEPVLLLDPVKLRAAVAKYRPAPSVPQVPPK